VPLNPPPTSTCVSVFGITLKYVSQPLAALESGLVKMLARHLRSLHVGNKSVSSVMAWPAFDRGDKVV
jgi:hypothetical protein